MHPGSFGGILVVLGCLALIGTAVLGATGASISVANLSPVGIVAALGLGSIALGAVLIGFNGRPPLDGRVVRSGLVTLGIGIGLVLASASATLSSPLVLGLFGGGLLILAGSIATAIGLFRAAGRSRLPVILLGAGLALNAASGAISSSLIESGAATSGNALTVALAVAGGVLVLAAIAGVGMLAIGPLGDLRPRSAER